MANRKGRYTWWQPSPGGWATVYRWNCGPGWTPAAAGTYLVRDTCWVSSLAVSQIFKKYIIYILYKYSIYILLFSHSAMSDSLVTPWTVARLLCPLDFPGKNTRVGCHYSGKDQCRDQTHISCIGRQVLYHWVTRGALYICVLHA